MGLIGSMGYPSCWRVSDGFCPRRSETPPGRGGRHKDSVTRQGTKYRTGYAVMKSDLIYQLHQWREGHWAEVTSKAGRVARHMRQWCSGGPDLALGARRALLKCATTSSGRPWLGLQTGVDTVRASVVFPCGNYHQARCRWVESIVI